MTNVNNLVTLQAYRDIFIKCLYLPVFISARSACLAARMRDGHIYP